MRLKLLAVYVLVIGAIGVSVRATWSQSTASITGTVTDPSGAVVPGAHVTVHSIATGEDRVISTDSAGLYVVPSLVPGDYSIQVTATGFGPYKLQKLTLQVALAATANVRLSVSSAGETVEVSDTAAQIDSQTITVGQVIDKASVQDLPLNGRHFLDLTVLTPGSVVADTAGNLTTPLRGLGANAFLTAGNREDSINFQINGVNLNDISQNQLTFQPSISTTSEFKVDNSTFSAEYGRSDGSIVTVATRSGTNQFHGEAFDYFRNEAMDARNYFNRSFNPATGASLGVPGDHVPFKRDNFGGDVGGPVWRNHTFFFGSYEGLRQHQSILQNSTVLTNAASTTTNSSGQTVYIPNQRAAVAAAGMPAANALLASIPLPNSGNNYVNFTPGPVNIDQYTGDILHNISASDSLHGFYAFQNDTRTEPALQYSPLTGIPGWGDHRHAHRQIGTLSETHIFNSNLVNDARLGFNRIGITFAPANLLDPTSVHIGDGLSGNKGIPQILLSDISLTLGGPSGFPQGRTDTLGVVADTLSQLKGKHDIKYGAEFRRYLTANFAGNIGTLTYTSSLTTSTVSAADAQAKTQADLFEQDMATIFSVQPNNVTSRIYANALGVFAQDDYKIAPNFTLEAGLRWEWNGTPVEGANRFTIFNPSNVTLTQVGTNGLSRTAAYNQNYNWEPRLGFSWDLSGTGKTVLRGAYGYLVDQPVEGVVNGLYTNPPFSNSVAYNGAAIPVSNLYQSASATGIAVSWVNPKYSNAYVESFNLNLQQALPWGVITSMGYYGSLGRHLLIQTNANQPVGASTTHPYTALAANSPVAATKPINTNIPERNSNSFSDYNALWTSLAKSTSHGFEFNMNLDWSKSLDLNSLGSQGGYVLPDSLNPRSNYGLSDFDVRLHYAGTAIYMLPFKGNRFKEGYQFSTIFQYQTGNPVNIVAGSESWNGLTGLARPTLVGKYAIAKQQTAGLTNVTYIQNPAGTVCNITSNASDPGCAFQIQQVVTNPATGATAYTGLGTMHRNALSGPGFANLDFSGEKDTKITEHLNFNLRADAFDIFNHPNFGQPTGNVQSSTFGQISATRFLVGDAGSSRQLQISGKFVF
jgi:hypothetical protein